MKKIYLNKKEFTYDKIEDLEEEFQIRNIIIGSDCSIGDYTSFSNNISIGNNVSIGSYCSIGKNSVFKTNSKLGNRSTVGNYCTISDSVSIGYRTSIGNYVSILPNTMIKNRCIIGNNSIVGTNCKINSDVITKSQVSIGNDVVINNNVFINYSASIRDQSFICSGSTIGDYSLVEENTKLRKNLYIVGSLGPISAVTYTGSNNMSIGCKSYDIDELIANFKEIGEEEGLDQQQINEYKEYLFMIDKFRKL